MRRWLVAAVLLLALHFILPFALAATSVMERPHLWPAFGALMVVRLLVALALPGVALVAILDGAWRLRG